MNIEPSFVALPPYVVPADPRRRIFRRSTFNARDAGGYPLTEAGLRMRDGVLFRSDALAYLETDEIQDAERMGVRLVVDLRDPHERDNAPDKPIPGAENLSVMLFEGTLASFPPENYPKLPELYRLLLTTHIHRIVEALEAISRVVPDPVLVHCSAGKDRTGIMIALLQHLLGVPQTLIVEDYAATEQLLAGGEFSKRIEQLFDDAGLDRRIIGPEPIASPGHYLDEALQQLVDEHGAIENFLRSRGLSTGAIERIRDGLTVAV